MLREIRDGYRGQFTIVSLVEILIMLIVYSKLYPVIEPFILNLTNVSDPATGAIISMVPFFIAVAIIMSITWYIIPQRR
jgi:hypothetical protein